MSKQQAPMNADASFSRLARDYCEWAEGQPQSPLVDARHARSLLPLLYGAALRLPERFEDCERRIVDPIDYSRIRERFRDLPVRRYAQCFNPLADPNEEPVAADMADDLADVWRDLKRGLMLYDSGAVAGAEWQWRFDFDTHWGHHAAGALFALHAWFSQHMDEALE